MCVSGRPITADDALRAGLIEWIVEGDLVAGAVSLAREKADLPGGPPRTRERTDKLPAASRAAGHARGRPRAGRQDASGTSRRRASAVDAIAAAATLPFEEGCLRERELFFECARSEQAKALIYAFFAERAVAKVPGLPAEPPPPVKSVAIVGAGTMGGGIAMACANAGLDVTLTDTDAGARRQGPRDHHQELRDLGDARPADAPTTWPRAPGPHPRRRRARRPSPTRTW